MKALLDEIKLWAIAAAIGIGGALWLHGYLGAWIG